jgi:hypothetical protein
MGMPTMISDPIEFELFKNSLFSIARRYRRLFSQQSVTHRHTRLTDAALAGQCPI